MKNWRGENERRASEGKNEERGVMNPCTLMGWENERRALGRCWDDVLMSFEGYERDVW